MRLCLQLETVVMKGRPPLIHFPPPLPTSVVVFFVRGEEGGGGGFTEQHVILNCIFNSPTLNAASAVNLGAV